jgi:hypothetical protein
MENQTFDTLKMTDMEIAPPCQNGYHQEYKQH